MQTPAYYLDHVGLAVKNLDEAIELYKHKMGLECSLREVITSQNVEIAFLQLQNSRLELLAPYGAQSKLGKFLEKRGEGLHHICYRVPDIKAELKRLTSLGVKLIDQEPRPGAHGSLIAFLYPDQFSGVLTELCEY